MSKVRTIFKGAVLVPSWVVLLATASFVGGTGLWTTLFLKHCSI